MSKPTVSASVRVDGDVEISGTVPRDELPVRTLPGDPMGDRLLKRAVAALIAQQARALAIENDCREREMREAKA